MTDTANTPDPGQPAEPVEETWAYAGERLGGQRLHAWSTEPGDPTALSFWDVKSKIAGVTVGGLYRVQAIRGPGGSLSVRGVPSFALEHHPDEALVTGWQAQHARTRSETSRVAAEKRMAKSGPLDLAMADLERLAKQQRTWADIDALVAEVSRRLRRSWDSK